jgi:hypothetical protein
MDFYGLTLYTIQDKSGGLIDVQLFFTAERSNGTDRAVYGFRKRKVPGKDPTKDKLARETFDAALNHTKSPGTLTKIGTMPTDPVQWPVSVNSVSDIVPKRGTASAEIFIGKKDTQGFRVRVAIPKVIAVEVGFVGDPGTFNKTSFLGEIFFLGDFQDGAFAYIVSKVLQI